VVESTRRPVVAEGCNLLMGVGYNHHRQAEYSPPMAVEYSPPMAVEYILLMTLMAAVGYNRLLPAE
jgi:hypothetical protein